MENDKEFSKIICESKDMANPWIADTLLRDMGDGSWVMVFLGGGLRPDHRYRLRRAYITRSQDQGQTWSPVDPMDLGFFRQDPELAILPTDLMVRDNVSTLFCGTHYGSHQENWQCWYLQSNDSCRTWSTPKTLPEPLDRNTWIQDHLITRDGRIVLCFQHYVSCSGKEGQRPCINPRNGVAISADDGKSWTVHGWIRTSTDDNYDNWAEPQIVELADGTISMLIRAQQTGVLYRADSTDGGYTWPDMAKPTDIPNPGSKFILYSLGDDKIAILHNPISERVPPALGRDLLSLWISTDGMRNWQYKCAIDRQPEKLITDPDGFVSKDMKYLHLVYNISREQAKYCRIKLPSL